MEKMSLYDLFSFVLPGGTMIIFLYFLIGPNMPEITANIPGEAVMAVPFLFISYLTGHVISLLGKFIEKKLIRFKTPWVIFLNKHKDDATRINALCNKFFGAEFILPDGKIDIDSSDNLYDKIYDYLEVQEKAEKVKILISQYGFFRNSSAIWAISFLIALVMFLLTLFNNNVGYSQPTLIIALIIAIILYFTSTYLLKKRKLLAMSVVYRTFLSLNINH